MNILPTTYKFRSTLFGLIFLFTLLSLFIIFHINSSNALAAQSVIVTVGSGGGNLSGASVSISGGGVGYCTTNSLGYCSINILKPGYYTISASFRGYTSASVYKYVGAGQNLSLRLNLTYGDGTGGPNPANPGGYSPPPPAAPPVSSLTTAYVCVYRNGQLIPSALVQLSGYGQTATGDGCHTYNVYKNQTIGVTAYANGQSKFQSIYVYQSPVSMRFDMPSLSSAPPKSSGQLPGSGQTSPKQINVSIKKANGELHTELVTISLKNTHTGQVTSRSTTSGNYLFSGLLGGTYRYQVSAALSNVSKYSISGTQTFDLGFGTKNVTFTVNPKNPGITITKPSIPPNTSVNVTVKVQRGSNAVSGANVSICTTETAEAGKANCPKGLTNNQGETAIQVEANKSYVVYASQGTTRGQINLTTNTSNRSITVQLAGTAQISLPTSKQNQISGTVYHQVGRSTVAYKASPVRIVATNSLGQTKTVTTDTATGKYYISGLNAKSYTVTMTAPSGTQAVNTSSKNVSFSSTVNEAVVDFTLTGISNTTQPSIAPSKVNLTIKTQTQNGAAISGVQVCVDPDGRGCFTSNSEGKITTTVDKNVQVNITASKTGLQTYNKSYTPNQEVEIPAIMYPSAPPPLTAPLKSPTQPTGKKSISGIITVQGQSGVYVGSPVQLTLRNLRTNGTALITIGDGTYIFDNLNNATIETYEIKAELINADSTYAISAPVRVTLNAGQHGKANFTITQSAANVDLGSQDSGTQEIIQGAEIVEVSLLLQGIGKGGDNLSQGQGNTLPLRPIRPIEITFYDTTNALVQTVNSEVTYNQANGSFTGRVTLPSTLPAGAYTTKVSSPGYLSKTLPGITLVSTSGTLQLAQTTLITGDVNLDNQLSVLDYSQIIDCYSDFRPSKDCNETKLKMADLNDDGSVNQFDYNIFLRNLSVQKSD